MARNIQETYNKLKNLATNSNVKGEQAAAQTALDNFEKRYGNEINSTDIEIKEIKLNYQQNWEVTLIKYVAGYLDLKLYNVENILTKRKYKHFILEGETHLTKLAKELYTIHRKNLKAKFELFAVGYCEKSLPFISENIVNGPRLTPAEEIALCAGFKSGEGVNKLRLPNNAS